MMRSIPRRVFSLALLTSGLPATRAMAQAQRPLEMGLLPNISVRTLMAQYRPLREYLERSLGRPVQLSTAPNWNEFHRRVLAREYDVMVTAAHVGRLAQLDRGYRPVAQLVPDIDGLFVCAAARPLARAADLRGKALVLSNPQSLVAVHGLHWLAENGLRQGQNYTLVHALTDDNAGNMLVRGDVDAALVSSVEFSAIADAVRMQLKVVSQFARVPGFVIMASAQLDADAARALQSVLLAFDGTSAEGRAFLASTGLQGIRAVPAGVLASMDPLLAATRALLAGAS